MARTMFDDNDKDKCKYGYGLDPHGKDIRVQLFLSLSLGISALVTFCVCLLTLSLVTPKLLELTTDRFCLVTDSPPAMADPLCCSKASAGSQDGFACIAKDIHGMDIAADQGYGGADSQLGWPRCLCGEFPAASRHL